MRISPIQSLINILSISPKRVFLFDGIGALLSVFSLGVILVKFESFFGMPVAALNMLTAIACLYAIYSFSCYFLIVKNWRSYLKVILFGNILYCCITLLAVIYDYKKLTIYGFAYFLLDLMVITCVVLIEQGVLASKPGKEN